MHNDAGEWIAGGRLQLCNHMANMEIIPSLKCLKRRRFIARHVLLKCRTICHTNRHPKSDWSDSQVANGHPEVISPGNSTVCILQLPWQTNLTTSS